MYIKSDIKRPDGNPGAALVPRNEMVFIDVDDVLFMPSPDDAGVIITDDIILRDGAYAQRIYMTPGTVEQSETVEGETDQKGFKPGFKFNHPGNKQEVREFKYYALNRNFIVIMNYCSGEPSDLIGSVCSPVQIAPSLTANSSGVANTFEISQAIKGDGIKIYKGTIPYAEPAGVVAAAAKAIPFTVSGQYQLTAGEAAITSVTGGKDGDVITVLGVASGVAPTIGNVASAIILRNGATFTATPGSQLTLRAIGQEAGKVIWVEQSRYTA